MALDVEVVQHSQFFDFLANLVQAKHYYDTDQELLNPKYMKKTAREEAKRSMKEQYTKNKKAKLNPDTAATTLSVQQRQAAGEQQEDEQPSSAPQAGLLSFASSSKQLSRDELREKLRQKVEAMRAQRNLDELPIKQNKQKKTAQAAKEWRQKQLAMKQQQSDQQQEQQQRQKHQRAQQQQKKQQQQNQQGKKQQKPEEGLKFGNLVIGQGNRPWDHKKKASKEELLKQAEAKKQQLAEAGQTAEGKVQVKQEAWRSALNRAKGEKVLDDPKLLRKSLKKDQKRREKSGKVWQERKAAQQEQQDKRQAKRKENLAVRAQGKIQKKKEKREKKLLGAGFEGRKEGFIGDKGKAK